MCLSRNIRYLRKKKEMSQDSLAQYLGYKSYTTIQKWETGVSEPPIKQLRKMAELFQVDIDDMAKIDIEKKELHPEQNTGYYLNPETAALAQEMFDDPQMRSLFHMKRTMEPEKFQAHFDMMKKLYQMEHPEEDDDFTGC